MTRKEICTRIDELKREVLITKVETIKRSFNQDGKLLYRSVVNDHSEWYDYDEDGRMVFLYHLDHDTYNSYVELYDKDGNLIERVN